MQKDKNEPVLVKRIVQEITWLIIVSVGIYFLFRGNVFGVGVCLLLGGVLNGACGIPWAAPVTLAGVMCILAFCKQAFLLKMVALVMLVIVAHDLIQLVRLLANRECSILFNKDEIKNFPLRMRESEMVYKIWRELKRKWR